MPATAMTKPCSPKSSIQPWGAAVQAHACTARPRPKVPIRNAAEGKRPSKQKGAAARLAARRPLSQKPCHPG